MNEELAVIKCDDIYFNAFQSIYSTPRQNDFIFYIRKEHFKYLNSVKHIENFFQLIKPFLHNPNGPALIYEKIEFKYSIPSSYQQIYSYQGQLQQTAYNQQQTNNTQYQGLLNQIGNYLGISTGAACQQSQLSNNLPQTSISSSLPVQNAVSTITEYYLDGIEYKDIKKFNEDAERYKHNLEFKKNLKELIND